MQIHEQAQAELLRFWDYSRNSNIEPDNLGPYSNLKARWHHEGRAIGEEHVWQASPNKFLINFQKALGAPCPICPLFGVRYCGPKKCPTS